MDVAIFSLGKNGKSIDGCDNVKSKATISHRMDVAIFSLRIVNP